MRLTIDSELQTLTIEDNGQTRELGLYSRESFEAISRQWLKVGWNEKYPYTFSWFGRPIIQLPEDMIRMQEVLYQVQPDVIIETGVAHGGSLIYYASLCRAMGKGRIVGIDIEIRPHNRKALEEHELISSVSLIEGSSVDPDIVREASSHVKADDTVLVILDSCHTKAHVEEELEAYAPLVTPGSYIVATDGSMLDLHDVPRGQAEWKDDHPAAASLEFAERHPEFVVEQPAWPFNESELRENITHWPHAWLRRLPDRVADA